MSPLQPRAYGEGDRVARVERRPNRARRWRLGTVTGLDQSWASPLLSTQRYSVDGPRRVIVRWDDPADGCDDVSLHGVDDANLCPVDEVPIDERHWVPESVRDQLVRQEAAGRLRAIAAALDHDPGLLELATLMDDLVGPGGGGWLLTGGWVSTADLLRGARALLNPAPAPATTP